MAYSEGPAFLCAVCGNGVVVTVRDRALCIGGMAHVVYVLAHVHKRKNGKPGWNIKHRGFKFRHLSIRAEGGRVKK